MHIRMFSGAVRRMWAVMAAMLLFAAGMLVYSPKAHAQSFGPFALRNGNGLCMDVRDYSTSNGAVLQVYDCTYASNQNFIFYDTPAFAVYTITASNSGKCLDIRDASTANGAQLQQWTCNGQSNQLFYIYPITATSGSLQPLHVGGKCLTASGNYNTALVVQSTCNGSAAQEWEFL